MTMSFPLFAPSAPAASRLGAADAAVAQGRAPNADAGSLLGLFSPNAVAMVGASPELTRYGGRVFKFLRGFGFDGPIWPVNPKYTSVLGLPCFPSLLALPGRPDHVGIAVGPDRVMATLEECASIGVGFVTVFTAGYAENGTAKGRAEQERIARFVRDHGMRLLGPNCNGVINWHRRLALTGTAAVLGEEMRQAGHVAVMAQSGGAGAVNVMWRAMRAGLDVNYHASTGNEADIDLLDLARFAVEDPSTDIVLLFAERIGDGVKLARVAEMAAERGKVILVQKLGRSAAGARAAISHTGALTGSDRVHDAAFRQLGLVRVESPQHLYEAAMLFQQRRALLADGIAAVSSSGGNIVLAADLAERYGCCFPEYGEATQAALAELVPGYINVRNPTDLSPEVIGNTSMFSRTLETLAADPSIGALMPIVTQSPRLDVDNVLATLASLEKPSAMVWVGGCSDGPHPTHDHLDAGVPVYRDVDTALRAMNALMRHARFLARRKSRAAPARPKGIDIARARGLLLEAPGRVVPEYLAKQILAAYGFPVTLERRARDLRAAVAAFEELGGPVALKIESAGIPHKTEAGGVRLGLTTCADVAQAFDEVMAAGRTYAPSAQLDGVLVQEMVGPGLELILGVSRDPVYGPIVSVGLGGLLVEVLHDTVLRLPPLTLADAHEMLNELAGARLLGVVRGRPARDRDAVAELLVRLSWLAVDLADEIDEIDVNPVLVLERSRGAVAVDALVVRRAAPSTESV